MGQTRCSPRLERLARERGEDKSVLRCRSAGYSVEAELRLAQGNPGRALGTPPTARDLTGLLGGRAIELLLRGVVVLLSGLELCAQLGDRCAKVVAAQGSRLGKSGIGEMPGILHARAFFLGLDLAVEITGDGLELTDHHFQVTDFAGFFVQLEAL